MPEFQAKTKNPQQPQTDSHSQIHDTAVAGLRGSGAAIPHLKTIQASFGSHPFYDLSQTKAHVDSTAKLACKNINAHGYTVGNHMALHRTDLHTVAHEAAHMVQQRAGVQLKSKVGGLSDHYERHADAVADGVVRGQSVAGLLASMPQKAMPGGQRSLVQGKFKSAPLDTDFAKTKMPDYTAIKNNPGFGGFKSETGCPVWAHVFVTRVTKTTKAYPPNGFDHWAAYGNLGLLNDPTRTTAARKQNLTKLHTIRGKFFGPSVAGNMFLGTAPSNNYNAESHYNQIEQPIETFLDSSSQVEGVYYKVTPDYDSGPPAYFVRDNISKLATTTEQTTFTKWAKQACPPTFNCEAIFYRTNATTGDIEEFSQQQTQLTTIGAPTVAAAATPVATAAPMGAPPIGFGALTATAATAPAALPALTFTTPIPTVPMTAAPTHTVPTTRGSKGPRRKVGTPVPGHPYATRASKKITPDTTHYAPMKSKRKKRY